VIAPAPRSARREKTLDVVPLSDSELRLIARLIDTSTALDDPADVELIHELRIEATVTLPDLVIREIAAHADQQPYDRCAHTAAPVSGLTGVSLRRGYRRAVMDTLGGTLGCSHFLTLALDLSAANILSIYLRMRTLAEQSAENRADGTWAGAALRVEPGLMNACMALAEDSPVQHRAHRALDSGAI
jgi:hypothetical protein